MADISRITQRLEELRLEDHPKAKQLLRELTYAQQVGNRAAVQRIKTRLHVLIQRFQEYPFTEDTPSNSYTDNIITLGETLQQERLYTVQEEELTKHLLSIGQSGSGKTSTIYNILLQLSTPFWAFDRKQDYRHLINKRNDILVLPWNRLRFNPLKPPEGVGPIRWAMVISEILSHSTDLLSGSRNYVLTHIIELYKQYDLFTASTEPYPSLTELESLMKGDKINFVRKTSNYRDTVLNRVEPMTEVTGPVFNCSQGHKIPELLHRNVVFEFGGLNRDIQNFLQEALFAHVYEYLLANRKRGTGLELVLVMDEAKKIFSYKKEQSDAAGIPEIDDLFAKAREFGLGTIVSDQEATKLTDSVKANTDTKILLPTGDHKQFKSIADSMDLSQLQRQYSHRLGVGQAIIKHGFNRPVPVNMHYVDLNKNITDAKLKQHQNRKWKALEYTLNKSDPLRTGREASKKNRGLNDFL